MKSFGGNAKLDQFVLDIEFLLISVVQGVAIAALASAAIGPISNLQFEYWPYIVSAFLVSFIFWSQAIIHALSFIDWPLDLSHNFLYFLASFVQVLAFSNMTDPVHWFAFITGLFVIAAILYVVDYMLIKNRKKDFSETEDSKELYKDIEKEHIYEMKLMLPAGLIFNSLAVFFILKNPSLFIDRGYHVVLISVQVIFEAFVLANSIKSFKKRSFLIAKMFR